MTDKGSTEFLATFYKLARQLRTPAIAADWYKLSLRRPLTATQAAGYANLGFMPGEIEHGCADDAEMAVVEHWANRHAAHIYRNGSRIA